MNSNSKSLVRALAVAAACLAIAGCGSSGPSPKNEQARVDKLTSIRALFDKAHGNYDSLSASDKAEFLKLCDSDQQKATQTWNLMKTGPVKPPSN